MLLRWELLKSFLPPGWFQNWVGLPSRGRMEGQRAGGRTGPAGGSFWFDTVKNFLLEAKGVGSRL